jgi:hypothetical protein
VRKKPIWSVPVGVRQRYDASVVALVAGPGRREEAAAIGAFVVGLSVEPGAVRRADWFVARLLRNVSKYSLTST